MDAKAASGWRKRCVCVFKTDDLTKGALHHDFVFGILFIGDDEE